MSGKGEKDNAKHKRESAPTNVYAQLLADEQSIQPVVSKLSEHDFDFEPATRSSSANSQVSATFSVLILSKMPVIPHQAFYSCVQSTASS